MRKEERRGGERTTNQFQRFKSNILGSVVTGVMQNNIRWKEREKRKEKKKKKKMRTRFRP